MLAQIAFEPRQLPRRPLLRPAVVQHCEMRAAGIEAVMRRLPRVLAEQPLRRVGPYIVIAGRQVKRNPAVGFQDAPHYSFDSGGAHFTVLDNSRAEQWPAGELAWLESDLREHAAAPVKFVVSHRPTWLLDAALGGTSGPLHRLAKRYGACCVI